MRSKSILVKPGKYYIDGHNYVFQVMKDKEGFKDHIGNRISQYGSVVTASSEDKKSRAIKKITKDIFGLNDNIIFFDKGYVFVEGIKLTYQQAEKVFQNLLRVAGIESQGYKETKAVVPWGMSIENGIMTICCQEIDKKTAEKLIKFAAPKLGYEITWEKI